VVARDPPPAPAPAGDPGAGPTSEDMAPSSAGSLGTTRELREEVVPDGADRGGTAADASISGQTHSGGTT
jgi:hypothetical protein